MESRKKNVAIVCCHAIYQGSEPTDERNWRLQSFQRSSGLKPGEHLTFLRHIETAVELLESKSVDSVIFSGGRTNPDVAHLSEAQSYLNALQHTRRDAIDMLLLEEHATDSYQNLLFSIILFRQTYGYYPDEIVIITHTFKTARFLDLHAKAIHWPLNRIRVLGINPPFSQNELESTIAMEHRHAYLPFSSDLYGTGEALARKRSNRRWDPDTSILDLSNGLEDVVKQLLLWAGGDDGIEVFPQALPWE
ncbi:hypothetical protein E2P81_ATG11804 [Venturia nashicola]|uniref:DUF218 domain-containing protein n=1 Tax=Venturia nashicola TaxID=86259 RepID=A0A4Z1P745_9PEZI|nr:hypothetical protein E6O75_ATG11495 [Venturia nashicola]TLD24468.1 hypothetical protein E2P81_ATG11804 [Venturia nashicola]